MKMSDTGIILGSTKYRRWPIWRPKLRPPHYTTFIATEYPVKTVWEYDLATDEQLRAVCDGSQLCEDIVISDDGQRMLLPEWNRFRVVDIDSGEVLLNVTKGSDNPEQAVFSPTGDRLAVILDDAGFMGDEWKGIPQSVVELHPIGSSGQVQRLYPHSNYYLVCQFSRDGRYLGISGGRAGRPSDTDPSYDPDADESLTPAIQFWDLVTGEEVACLRNFDFDKKPHNWQMDGGVICIYQSKLNLFFCVSIADLNARMANPRYFNPRDLPGEPSADSGLCTLDGRILIVKTFEGVVYRYDLKSGLHLDTTRPTFEESGGFDLGLRPGNTAIVWRLDQNLLVAHKVPGGEPLTECIGHPRKMASVEFCESDQMIRTTGQQDVRAWYWDATTGEAVRWEELPKSVSSIFVENGWIITRGIEGVSARHQPSGRNINLDYPNGGYSEGIFSGGWVVYSVDVPELEATPCDPYRSRSVKYNETAPRAILVRSVPEMFFWQTPPFSCKRLGVTLRDGRMVIAYNSVDEHELVVKAYSVDSTGLTLLWQRTFPSRPKDTADIGKVRRHYNAPYEGYRNYLVWAAGGSTVLIVPTPDRKPFLLDANTGELVANWTAAPASVTLVPHPKLPIAAASHANGVGILLCDWTTGETLLTVDSEAIPFCFGWSSDGSRLGVGLPNGLGRVFAME